MLWFSDALLFAALVESVTAFCVASLWLPEAFCEAELLELELLFAALEDAEFELLPLSVFETDEVLLLLKLLAPVVLPVPEAPLELFAAPELLFELSVLELRPLSVALWFELFCDAVDAACPAWVAEAEELVSLWLVDE